MYQEVSMNEHAGFKVGLKVFLFWVFFLVLYGLYKAFPIFPFSIFCGVDESNFQHFKTTFFTLMILNLVEFVVHRKQIKNVGEFWHVRMLVTTFAPWMVFLLWYLAPAIHGTKMPNIPMEIIYSNVITVIAGFYAVTFERHFGQNSFSPSLKFITYSLFSISIVLYMVFTFSHLPWADVFIEADWR